MQNKITRTVAQFVQLASILHCHGQCGKAFIHPHRNKQPAQFREGGLVRACGWPGARRAMATAPALAGQVGRRWQFGRMLPWPPLYLAVRVVLGLRGRCVLMFAHGDVLAGWGPVCIPVSAHVHCRHLRHGPGVALRTLHQERRAHLARPCMHTGMLRVCGWPCGPSVLPGMPFD